MTEKLQDELSKEDRAALELLSQAITDYECVLSVCALSEIIEASSVSQRQLDTFEKPTLTIDLRE